MSNVYEENLKFFLETGFGLTKMIKDVTILQTKIWEDIMKTSLQSFVISTALMNDDLFGKNGAKHELGENKVDLMISTAKIFGMFSMFFLPTAIILMVIVSLSFLIFGNMVGGAYALCVFLE